MSQQDGFYNQTSLSGSGSRLPFARPSKNGSNASSGDSNTQRPYFAASTSSLPGALGLGTSSSSPSMPLSAGRTTSGWTVSSNSTGGSNSSQWQRSSPGSSSNSQQEHLLPSHKVSSRPSMEDIRGIRPKLYQMRSTSASSLHDDGMNVKLGTATPLPSSQSSGTITSAARERTSNSTNNARNFLVPIGATGARQKLSILSASQRPMATQVKQMPQRSRTKSNNSSTQGDEVAWKRPQSQEDQNGSKMASSLSGASFESSRVNEKNTLRGRIGSPIADGKDLSRSISAERLPSKPLDFDKTPPRSTSRWTGGTNKGSLPVNMSPKLASATMDALGNWSTGSSPTQEASNPLFRQASQENLGNTTSALLSTSQSSLSHTKNQSTSKYGRNMTPKEGAAAVEQGNYTSEANSGLRTSSPMSRGTESAKGQQTGRPSSSSGKERAAKIGAGFKNMFSARGQGKEPSSRQANAGAAMAQVSDPYESPSFLPGPSSQRPSNLAQNRSDHIPSTLQRPIVNLNTAESAGWTSSPERSQLDQAFAASSSSSSALANAANSTTWLDAEQQGQLMRGGVEFKKASEEAPSLDFTLPVSNGLFDDLESDQYFSYESRAKAEESKIAAGEKVPSLSRFDDRERVTRARAATLATPVSTAPSQEKTLPRTPNFIAYSHEFEKVATPPSYKSSALLNGTGDAKSAQLPRHPSSASVWSSQNTAVRPSSGATKASPHQINSPISHGDLIGNNVSSSSSNGSNSHIQRNSNATVFSDVNGSSLSDAMHNLVTRRTSSSAQSTSEESSTYSAPNSSRAWSPANFDNKPNVPITSPLLAPVLGQQSQQQAQSFSEPLSNAQKRAVALLGQGSTSFMDDSGSNDSMTSASTSNAASRALNDSSSFSFRPDLPVKSRERSSTLQPDVATLAKLEKGSLVPVSQPTTRTNQGGLTTATSDGSVGADPPGMTSKKPGNGNGSMYVPPGLLSYTRKGHVVRPSQANSSRSTPSGPGSTERTGRNSSKYRKEFEGSFALPNSQSQSTMEKSGSEMLDESLILKSIKGEDTDSEGQIISLNSNDFDTDETEMSIDVVNLLPSSAWAEVESALLRFKIMSNQNGPTDKGGLLRSVLLPFLALEAETPNVDVSGSGQFQYGKSRRALFFDWIQQLLLELQIIQTSADRGAILESIACIIESRNFSATMFQRDEGDEKRFHSVFGHILSYAIGELNKKGVYQNTLIFSGRLLAIAFFRIAGVASKLLRALPVNRFALERVASEASWDRKIPKDWEAYKSQFPASLHDFCFQDARSYLKMLDAHSSTSLASSSSALSSRNGLEEDDDRYLVRQPEVEVEMSGNWLRRWQSDDSELFFSFCRSYHRQLAGLLATSTTSESSYRGNFFGGPGYAHLATCIHQKCLSLVHRDILSVTTLSSQKNFNPGETANVLSGSTAGKPRHLEAANRRCTAIIVDIIRAPSSNNHLFGPMLSIHIKSLIKRTSLYDVQGVFCLLDWLDGVLSHMESAEFPIERLVDIDFIIETIWLLLKDADHALALMRTIAFCYSNFAVLTSTSRNRIRFCEEILLNAQIFQKLFLSWSFTIRAYFLHLLVFRLARINDFDAPEDDNKGKTAISIARLFNRRLDEIRKRHDELSPSPSSTDSSSEDDDEFSHNKKRAQSFVSTIKRTPSVPQLGSPSTMTKAERVLGIGMPDPVLSNKGENKAQSRAAKWLRVLGGGKGASTSSSSSLAGKGGGKRAEGMAYRMNGSPSSSLAHSPKLLDAAPHMAGGSPTLRNGNRKIMPKLEEQDLESDEGEDEDDSDRGEIGEEADESDEAGRGSVDTPRANDDYEFSFEGKPGQREQRSALEATSSAGELSPKSKSLANLLSNDEDDKQINDHISPNISFDLQSPTLPYPPQSTSLIEGASNVAGLAISTSNGNSKGSNANMRVSRAFSKRLSILPGPAFNLVSHENESEEEDGAAKTMTNAADLEPSQIFALQKTRDAKKDLAKAAPYSQNLHIYAIQSLREYEQTVQEHDEFFSSQVDTSNPQVPKLPIQWPAMWSE
ncbi:hypothetical protein CBS101457_001905 [Exobasidium rhododendri]|nr:hypothetical protein CBS101457_001905 [Exobasidium rhododendri]